MFNDDTPPCRIVMWLVNALPPEYRGHWSGWWGETPLITPRLRRGWGLMSQLPCALLYSCAACVNSELLFLLTPPSRKEWALSRNYSRVVNWNYPRMSIAIYIQFTMHLWTASFSSVGPITLIFWFSESLERGLSDDVLKSKVYFWTKYQWSFLEIMARSKFGIWAYTIYASSFYKLQKIINSDHQISSYRADSSALKIAL